MTYERVVIECEENLGVFDRDHAMVPMTTAASGRAYRSTREAKLVLWRDLVLSPTHPIEPSGTSLGWARYFRLVVALCCVRGTFRSRTPGPFPPSVGMNSTPAFSRAV